MRIRQRGQSLQLIREASGPAGDPELLGKIPGPGYALDEETAQRLSPEERSTFDAYVGRLAEDRELDERYAVKKLGENLLLAARWLESASEDDRNAFSKQVRAPLTKLRRSMSASGSKSASDAPADT